MDGQVESGVGAVIDGCDDAYNRIWLPAQIERLTMMDG